MQVELHAAFVWDCDECGRENFERAVEGNLTNEILNAMDADSVAYSVAEGVEETGNSDEDGNEELNASALLCCVVAAPKHVKCKHCDTSFETVLYLVEADDE